MSDPAAKIVVTTVAMTVAMIAVTIGATIAVFVAISPGSSSAPPFPRKWSLPLLLRLRPPRRVVSLPG